MCVYTLFKTLLFYLIVCVSTRAHICTGMHVNIYELSPSAYRSPKVELNTPRTRLIGGSWSSQLGYWESNWGQFLNFWDSSPTPHVTLDITNVKFNSKGSPCRDSSGCSGSSDIQKADLQPKRRWGLEPCQAGSTGLSLSLSGQQYVSSYTVGWLEFQCRCPMSGWTLLIIKWEMKKQNKNKQTSKEN